MSSTIVALRTSDIRFPTSRERDGSDAMNPYPDYSAAYVEVLTDADDELSGHGFTFTIGRGNDVQRAAIDALAPLVVGLDLDVTLDDMGDLSRRLVHDSQLRWLGPEKGIMHMAIGAVLNALWDLKAKRVSKPLWKLLSDTSPDELVALVDFRYLTDALTPDEALAILEASEAGRADREAELLASGYPAYATSPGWLGYDDAKLARLCREAVDAGFRHIKLKVGADLEADRRRLALARAVCGDGIRIAIDANQIWDVGDAISWIRELAEFDLHWIEEPTSPDEILGHAEIARALAPLRIAAGEHVANRVVFKQLLQTDAISFVQLDAARVGGVNENVAILLLAARFGVPVCPHAGGVGLCELVQHLAMFDFVAVSGTQDERAIEYVDHLHEHFVHPAVIRDAHYIAPLEPGFSAEIRAESRDAYSYPDGVEWAARAADGS